MGLPTGPAYCIVKVESRMAGEGRAGRNGWGGSACWAGNKAWQGLAACSKMGVPYCIVKVGDWKGREGGRQAVGEGRRGRQTWVAGGRKAREGLQERVELTDG